MPRHLTRQNHREPLQKWPRPPGSAPFSMKVDYGRLWNNLRGILGKEVRVTICRDQGVVLCRDKGFCHTSPAFACGPTIGSKASGISSSAADRVQLCVQAVGTTPRRCIVPIGARSPTCPWLGPRSSCICRFVASSVGRRPVHGVFLPSAFRPSSRSLAVTVWASARPYVTWASLLAAVPARGSRTRWAYQGVVGRWCVWSIVRPSRPLRPHG
jgi:hypothetical protein